MRYLELPDFSRMANGLDQMSSIAEFKVPKGMVYSFSSRMNMSIFIQELSEQDGTGSEVAFVLPSDAIQCADLGAAETEGEDMENQIVVFVDGTRTDTWTITWSSMTITFDTAPASGTKNVQIFFCSRLNAAVGVRSGVLEIRCEAPAGQNLATSIFSNTLDQIMANKQNLDLAPLRLERAYMLPEGFVLAIKVNAAAAALDGTEVLHGDGLVFSDQAYAAERLRIPYERFPLRNFPRDFKARLLAKMAVT
ncbi:hypothetical protein ES702_01932 [subsurface metagenome]